MLSYSKPPITEAVIELRPTVALDQADQAKLARRLNKFYPTSLPQFEVKISLDENVIHPPKRTPNGFRLSTKDETDIAVIHALGLTTSRLAPYISWEPLIERTRDNWESLVACAGFHSVSRIGIRFINRIDVPVPSEKFDIREYVTIYPLIPFAEHITGCAMQVAMPTRHAHWNAQIGVAQIESPLFGHIGILLDIDVYRNEELPTKAEELWTVVNEGRVVKNELFSECITSRSEELIR